MSATESEDYLRAHTLVLDCGTGYLKCGFAGGHKPFASYPAMVGRPTIRSEETIGDVKLEEIMCGTECAALRQYLQITYPVTNGIIKSWTDMEHLWRYTLKKMNVDPRECSVLLTEAPLNPKINRKKMLGTMFNTFGFKRCHVATQAVLTLYAQGITTGVVMDSGDGVTHIVPVYDGMVLDDLTKRIDIAGRNITQYLLDLLANRGYAFNRTADFDTVREIKEKCCYVGYDLALEEKLSKETTVLVETFTLPDGRVVKVGRERFQAPEALFQPKLLDMESEGIHEGLFNVIQNSATDLRRSFYEHIVLSGGTSMYPGLPTRLEKEMKLLYAERVSAQNLCKLKLNIEDPPRRKHFVWMGGAVLADVGKDKDEFWITKQQWDEQGPDRIVV